MKRNRSQRGGSTAKSSFGVAGGFRAGKRRKGNSLIKRSPVVVKQIGDIRKESILETLEIDPKLVVLINGNGGVKEKQYRDPNNLRRQV